MSDESKTSDALYRSEIDKFGAYLSIKECDSLIEGFFASGHLMDRLQCPKLSKDVVVGLTGSIGRREAHNMHSDYDIAVIARNREARVAVISKLIRLNPRARFERKELFKQGAVRSAADEQLKDDYYPIINPDKLLGEDALLQRVWLLTEFTPLVENALYREVQSTLMKHYKIFSDRSLYAEPEKLMNDILEYPHAFSRSLEKTAPVEENEQRGLTTHAKTVILRKFAHLFSTLSLVRTVCRKYHIMTKPDGAAQNDEIFVSLRAPTIVQLGYWFSDEFHFDTPMRRFDSEKEVSSSEVFEKYMGFLKKESPVESPGSRGKVIQKLCQPLQMERGLVRRLFKRTSVELIENYNEGLKRIWTGRVREHLSNTKPSPSHLLKGEPEFENITELSQRVLWPLFALANLLSITFNVAGEWGYFEGQTYPRSGRAKATDRLVAETRTMLESARATSP